MCTWAPSARLITCTTVCLFYVCFFSSDDYVLFIYFLLCRRCTRVIDHVLMGFTCVCSLLFPCRGSVPLQAMPLPPTRRMRSTSPYPPLRQPAAWLVRVPPPPRLPLSRPPPSRTPSKACGEPLSTTVYSSTFSPLPVPAPALPRATEPVTVLAADKVVVVACLPPPWAHPWRDLLCCFRV